MLYSSILHHYYHHRTQTPTQTNTISKYVRTPYNSVFASRPQTARRTLGRRHGWYKNPTDFRSLGLLAAFTVYCILPYALHITCEHAHRSLRFLSSFLLSHTLVPSPEPRSRLHFGTNFHALTTTTCKLFNSFYSINFLHLPAWLGFSHTHLATTCKVFTLRYVRTSIRLLMSVYLPLASHRTKFQNTTHVDILCRTNRLNAPLHLRCPKFRLQFSRIDDFLVGHSLCCTC